MAIITSDSKRYLRHVSRAFDAKGLVHQMNSNRTLATKGAAIAAAALMVGGLAACGSGASGPSTTDGMPSTIRIGVPLDLTGSSAITGVGTGEEAGVKFAIDEINNSGYLGESKLEGVFYDTKANKTEAVSRTIQLTTQDPVTAIVGYTLTDSFLAAAPTAQEAGIPVMAVGLSGAGVTDVGDYMFRELLDYTHLFENGDPLYVKATGAKTAAYLYGSDTVTTSGQFETRSKLLESLGVKTVGTETLTATTTDISAQLTAIKSANPDLLVINVDTGQVPQVLSQIAASGLKTQILGDNALASKQTLASPTALQGAECGLFTQAWFTESQAGINPQFVKNWKTANNEDPDMFNALGRDAVWGVATAIKQAGTVNGEKVRDALHNLDAFQGALGDYKWAEDGQPTYQGVTMQIRSGKPEVWTPETPACQQ
ncbi:ABC transporter substrate-binding protein [Williamsia sp. 1138]|uniref:ABC transporter substrate-binding protein n=1 Tax=Williamsia sp. 1138 TaxID=1903117 RepID=UPI00143CCEBC|nr:ABC transporter substrate-binding protein [Williamsia sp. 1138]